jgi:hypothetical protein
MLDAGSLILDKKILNGFLFIEFIQNPESSIQNRAESSNRPFGSPACRFEAELRYK